MAYIVQHFKDATSECIEFNALTLARKYIERNPCSLLFRKEQVIRIEDGCAVLHAHDADPMK